MPRNVLLSPDQGKECTYPKKRNMIPHMATTTRKRTPMSNEHKAALAEGRGQAGAQPKPGERGGHVRHPARARTHAPGPGLGTTHRRAFHTGENDVEEDRSGQIHVLGRIPFGPHASERIEPAARRAILGRVPRVVLAAHLHSRWGFAVYGTFPTMRLTIIGGGGFRVPLVYRALLKDTMSGVGERCTEVTLYDTDPGRVPFCEPANGTPHKRAGDGDEQERPRYCFKEPQKMNELRASPSAMGLQHTGQR
jgi:hypothetical protein